MSRGVLRTCSVIGVYWMSWIISFWKTTLPGVVAMFSPSRNAFISVMVTLRRPFPRCRSSSKFVRPLSRFSPPVSIVFDNTSGFVAAKFEGANASTNCLV